MKYLINVFFIFVLCLSGDHLFAFGNMSAEEVRTLFTGNTAEGERRAGEKGGLFPPATVNTPRRSTIDRITSKGSDEQTGRTRSSNNDQ